MISGKVLAVEATDVADVGSLRSRVSNQLGVRTTRVELQTAAGGKLDDATKLESLEEGASLTVIVISVWRVADGALQFTLTGHADGVRSTMI